MNLKLSWPKTIAVRTVMFPQKANLIIQYPISYPTLYGCRIQKLTTLRAKYFYKYLNVFIHKYLISLK